MTQEGVNDLRELLGGRGIWTPELEEAILEWVNFIPREVICSKCGLREQKGDVPDPSF